MAKKKLLITTDCFLPRWDGVARFLLELLPYLKKTYDVTVIAPCFDGKLPKLEGVKVVRLPLFKFRLGDIYFSWFHPRKIRKIMKKHDLVFNQTIGPIGISAVRAAKKLKKPVVSYVHSVEWELAAQGLGRIKQFIRFTVRMIARSVYNKCTLLFVPSKQVEDLLVENKIGTPKKVTHLGIDTKRFIPPLNKRTAKKKVGINPVHTVIGFHGRIGREKNLPTLIDAFKQVHRAHPTTDLLIVGKGVPGEVKDDIPIILPGSVNNVVPYLQAMDIYVLPSLTETTSLATLEAMSAGVPVIVTPVGSIPEYVEDGKNGFIFPRHDVQSLREKLEILLHDAKLRAKMARSGRKTIEQKFQWQENVKTLLTELKSVA